MRWITIILLFWSLDVMSQSDTLNRTDSLGKKYSYWIIYGKDKPWSGFSDTSIMEEGEYDSGKKTGLWKTYHSNGRLKSEIEYKGNRPNGKFNTYYDNGYKEEEGTWRGTFYIDTFRRYDPSGVLVQEKIFNREGKTASYKNVHSGIYKPELIFNSNPLYTFCECEISVADTIYIYHDIVYKIVIHGEFMDKRIYNGNCEIYQSDTMLIISYKYNKGKLFTMVNRKYSKTTSTTQSDTLNRTGADGKKYGYWIIYGKDKPNSGFADTSKMEEGKYVSGKKTGLWKTYYASGIKKSEIEYKNNRPYGKYVVFDSTGVIEDSGIWKGQIVQGEFRRFDSTSLKYNPDGSEKKSVDGLHINSDSTKGNKEIIDSKNLNSYYDYDCKCYKNLTEVDNGYKKLYNENKQISIEGEFKNGKLFNGKYYFYDKNGLLDKIEIYKNGKYAGDAQID